MKLETTCGLEMGFFFLQLLIRCLGSGHCKLTHSYTNSYRNLLLAIVIVMWIPEYHGEKDIVPYLLVFTVWWKREVK